MMALSKKRLKFVLVLHLLLAFIMAVKLLSTVLDLLNIFWQPIEELYIPMAKPWEWIWFSSLFVTLTAFRAIKTNNSLQIKAFLVGIVFNCILPLLYCAYLYASDFWIFFKTRNIEKTSEVWRNYPVALYWYIFIGVAYQVHFIELYFGWELHRSINSHHRSK